MSLIGQNTTTTFLPWETYLSLVAKLERNKNYKFCLLIAVGVNTGLRIGDLLKLKLLFMTTIAINLNILFRS